MHKERLKTTLVQEVCRLELRGREGSRPSLSFDKTAGASPDPKLRHSCTEGNCNRAVVSLIHKVPNRFAKYEITFGTQI